MKILRWLLCHLLLVTVLVSLSLGFLFRESLKEDFYHLTGKSDQSVKDETVASEKVNKKQSSVKKKPSKLSTNDAEKKDQTVEVDQVKRNTHDPWAQVIPENSEINKPAEPVESNVFSGEGSNFPPDDYIPEENGSELNSSASIGNKEEIALSSYTPSAPDQSPTLMQGRPEMPAGDNSSIKSSDYFAALAEVRKLYWDGKAGAAQATYEKLMFDYPDQPEAAAELGNIFLQQGNRKAASWAYQNAIPRYLNLHREQEAINLMRFISQYDPAIAESLQKKYW